MRRAIVRRGVASAVAVVILAGAVTFVAWLPTRTRVGVVGTRLLVIAASVGPRGLSSVLARVFGTGRSASGRAAPVAGPGGPILVVTTARNPFSRYLAEILRAEGLNLFSVLDASELTAAVLAEHDVVVLGEMPLDDAQVGLLSAWTNAGGTLVAMRPDRRLGPLIGLSPAGDTLSDAYLRVETSAGPGVGIVPETIQFHGTADRWRVDGATTVAMLHEDATVPSGFPAVALRRVGERGGMAAMFAYDLARSVVYTRQGNPAWAGRNASGRAPKRVVDLFTPDGAGDSRAGWVDFDKLAIPQADEQQRLLVNLILEGNLHREPLPRFWYLPKGLNAAVIMTGDGHDSSGLRPRFDAYRAASPAGCSVDDWECVRATGYLYLDTTLSPVDAERYTDLGFEVALHVNTDCADWTPTSLAFLVGLQLRQFRGFFPRLPPPTTSRTHCAVWSDWSSEPEIEATQGIRLDTNYYFYPASWARGRAGLFNGSGFPMRFATRAGNVVDCYQAATQIPDESGLSIAAVCDELLDRANGPAGYYGVVTTNMHLEQPLHAGSDAIVASARAHAVPVVSARQMLAWLDGRDGSAFEDVRWDDGTLRFAVRVGSGARNLRGMLPVQSAVGGLSALTRDGAVLDYSLRSIKGIDYAFFAAEPGRYVAAYGTRREEGSPADR